VLGAFQIAFAATIQNFKLRLVDLQAAALPSFFHLAIERDKLAGLETVTQVFAVKPNAFQGGASLAGNKLKDGHAVAGAKDGGVAHFGNDGGHFSGTQFADAARVQAVFIAERQVVEQVLDGGNVLLLQPFGNARANALHKFYFCIEVQHSDDDKWGVLLRESRKF